MGRPRCARRERLAPTTNRPERPSSPTSERRVDLLEVALRAGVAGLLRPSLWFCWPNHEYTVLILSDPVVGVFLRAEELPFRGHYYSGDRWRREDLPTLRWRHRRHYDMRATFITLVLEDGADRLIIENRVTHTRKRRSAFDGYNRGLQWERTCAEVAKLKISRRSMGQDEMIALPVAVGAEGDEAADSDASRYSARYSPRNAEESHAENLVHSRRQRARTAVEARE